MDTATQTDGIVFVTDERTQRRYVQIDLDKFDKEYLEDLLDGLVAYSRRDEPTVSLEEVKASLRAAGKLDE